MKNSDGIVCPNCHGEKQTFVFADGHRPDGTRFADNRMRDCMTCKGAGTISECHAERIQNGKTIRDERVAKRLSLAEAAKQLGCSPAELSAVERGDDVFIG